MHYLANEMSSSNRASDPHRRVAQKQVMPCYADTVCEIYEHSPWAVQQSSDRLQNTLDQVSDIYLVYIICEYMYLTGSTSLVPMRKARASSPRGSSSEITRHDWERSNTYTARFCTSKWSCQSGYPSARWGQKCVCVLNLRATRRAIIQRLASHTFCTCTGVCHIFCHTCKMVFVLPSHLFCAPVRIKPTLDQGFFLSL